MAAVFGLASCDTDNEGAIYRPATENISFDQASPATVYTDGDAVTIPVRFIRSKTADAYTAHYTVTHVQEGIFTDSGNGEVTFAAGSGEAVVNIEAANLYPGVRDTCIITLSDADAATADTITKSQVAQTVITVMRNFNWSAAGSGTFYDMTFSGASATVSVEHADGTDLYRFVTPLQTLCERSADALAVYEAVPGGVSWEFTLDAQGNISVEDGIYDMERGTSIIGYQIYYDSANFASYCNIMNDGGLITWNFMLLLGNDLYTGGQFIFQWTDGYPVQ